jgi:O-methyltransferase domain
MQPSAAEPSLPRAAILNQLNIGCLISQALYVVATLGIADYLKDGPRTIDELAASAGANASALYRIMRALASVRVFTEIQPRQFGITELGSCLRSDVPDSVRALFRMAKWEWAAWGTMLQVVQTGRPGFRGIYGMDYFEYLQNHPDDAAIFDEAMTGFVSMNGMAVLAVYDFSSFGKLVDVGGGNGNLMAAILNTYPGMHGIVFDLPSVVSKAQRRIETAGLDDRCECIAGDFFHSPLPDRGDAYLLVSILHDWEDTPNVQILENCRRAVSAESKLLVIEMIIPPGDTPFFGKLLDLEMLVSLGGRERTLDEYGALLGRAGFAITRVIPTPGPSSIIEAVPG